MGNVTRLNLKDSVFRHLGDAGYFRDPSAPSIPIGATAAQRKTSVDNAIDNAIRHLVEEAGRRGVVFLNDSAVLKDYYQQIVTLTGGPTGGTFTLSMGHRTSAAIAYDAAAAAVLTALQAIVVSPTTLGVSGAAGGPWTAEWAIDTTTENVPCMRGDGSELTGGSNPSVSVAGTVSGTNKREYDLDMYLLDGSYVPNYESDLFVLRTDLSGNPVPMLWPEGGDYRMREFLEYYDISAVWDYPPASSSQGRALYLRGQYMGHTSTPTEQMTLTCYYTPQIPGLSGDTATLHAAGLTFLMSSRELIENLAAQQIAEDAGMDALRIGAIQARVDRYMRLYVERLDKKRHPVKRRLKAGWAD